jgi:bacterioferritin
MSNQVASSDLIDLLNQALARELQVSIQYMLQHAIGAGQWSPVAGKTLAARQSKFVATHRPYWLPGVSLKKIAITEMQHAEAISERIVRLGAEPTTQPDAITIGKTAVEMLENDQEQERQAVELYRHIIDVAERERDDLTLMMFRRILLDEEKHHRTFSDLLGETDLAHGSAGPG